MAGINDRTGNPLCGSGAAGGIKKEASPGR